jgi:tetratricopeptide (TPR) repeat protein
MNNLAVVYLEQRKYAQAEELFAAVLAGWRRLLGEEHSDTLAATENLGVAHLRQQHYALAKPLLTRTLEVRRRVLGPENAATLRAANHVAALQLEQAEYSEAETLLRSLLSLYEKIGSNSWLRFHTQSQLGASLTAQRKFAQAEPFLLAGYNGMLERQASIPAANRPDQEASGARLIQLYQLWGQPEKAAEWGKKLEGRRVSAGQ